MSVKKFFWITFLLIFIACSIGPVFALDLGISPPDINLKLNRGDVFRGELLIFGSDQEEINVTAYPMDWSLTIGGNYQFLPPGTIKRSVASWLEFTPKNFSLPPKRGQKIQYTIKVPADASGSYWGALMVSTNPSASANRDQFQILMAGRVAFIIRIDIIGSQQGNGNVEKFKLDWDKEENKIKASLRVSNSGASFIRFKGRLELKDGRGKLIGTVPFREGLVLPEYSREFTLVESSLKLEKGFYVGLAIADFGDRSLKAIQGKLEIK